MARHLPRMLAAALLLAVMALVGGCGGGHQRTAHRAPLEHGVGAAADGGRQLNDPPEVASRNGVLSTTIVVERRKADVGGRKLWALTYNGHYMPPTLRVRPGDRVRIAMRNLAGEDTNLHVHGLHVSPRSPSDDIFLSIRPGQTYHYAYQLPANLKPGTYWYHSHADMLSASQVAGGESGVIIVDGLRRHLLPDLRGITEHVIALKDFQAQGDEVKTKKLSIGAPTHRTVNGQLNPVIHIRPGETQLWRLANIGANIYYKLHLPGARFHVIAQDGYPVGRVYSADTLVIAAAARFDVLVRGGPPGTTQLETLAYNTGKSGNQFPRATLATVVSSGAPVPPARLPVSFAPNEDLSHAAIAARHQVVFTENTAGTVFYINGRIYDPHRVDIRSRLNTVEEWTVVNDSDEDHSFHLHTNQFQLMSTNGRPEPPLQRWHETVNVPARGRIVIRVRFTDFTGRTVFHCHILNHEDAGMMGVLDIVGDDPHRTK
jgi:FtsP/CotA-like multicopper oxidase with cupredoxin domain